jgi:hypothetical protein
MEVYWKTALWQQFGGAIDMLENALRRCPDDLWSVRMWETSALPPEFSEFWYVGYHCLFWLDLYLFGAVQGFMPPAPFTLDELDPAGVLPNRRYTHAELLEYLEACRRKCETTIESLTDESAQRVCKFSWGEVMFAGLLLDNMRHVQEHAAQLNMILGQKISAGSHWVSQKKFGS